MAKAKAWEVTDEFWSRVEPLIPVRQRVADQIYVAAELNLSCSSRDEGAFSSSFVFFR
jgi:hypothetical protein